MLHSSSPPEKLHVGLCLLYPHHCSCILAESRELARGHGLVFLLQCLGFREKQIGIRASPGDGIPWINCRYGSDGTENGEKNKRNPCNLDMSGHKTVSIILSNMQKVNGKYTAVTVLPHIILAWQRVLRWQQYACKQDYNYNTILGRCRYGKNMRIYLVLVLSYFIHCSVTSISLTIAHPVKQHDGVVVMHDGSLPLTVC